MGFGRVGLAFVGVLMCGVAACASEAGGERLDGDARPTTTAPRVTHPEVYESVRVGMPELIERASRWSLRALREDIGRVWRRQAGTGAILTLGSPEAQDEIVRRSVAWLLEHQLPDGSWENPYIEHNNGRGWYKDEVTSLPLRLLIEHYVESGDRSVLDAIVKTSRLLERTQTDWEGRGAGGRYEKIGGLWFTTPEPNRWVGRGRWMNTTLAFNDFVTIGNATALLLAYGAFGWEWSLEACVETGKGIRYLQRMYGGAVPYQCEFDGALAWGRPVDVPCRSVDETANAVIYLRRLAPATSGAVRRGLELGVEEGLGFLRATRLSDGTWPHHVPADSVTPIYPEGRTGRITTDRSKAEPGFEGTTQLPLMALSGG